VHNRSTDVDCLQKIVLTLVVVAIAGGMLGRAAPVSGAESRGRIAPPAGIPNLSQMALRVTDLPPGAKVKQQSYVPTSDVAYYVRAFKEGSARIGSRRLLILQSHIELARNVAGAASTFKQLRVRVSTKSGRHSYGEEAAQSFGLYVTKLSVGTPISLHVGHESLAIPLSISTPYGGARMVIAVHRTERVISFLYFATRADTPLPATSAFALVQPVAKHIHDELVR
jgi:hypothetical protein